MAGATTCSLQLSSCSLHPITVSSKFKFGKSQAFAGNLVFFINNNSGRTTTTCSPISIIAKSKVKDKEDTKMLKKAKEMLEHQVFSNEEEHASDNSDDEGKPKKIKKVTKVEKKDPKKAEKPKKKAGAIRFVKYHGLGNDFLLVDNRDSPEPKITEEEAVKLCDRNFGVGGDGVIFALPGTNGSDYTMRIFNSDGSEPEMCGNGVRCMARFIADLEGTKYPTSYSVSTLAGSIVLDLREDGQVVVDMGPPTLEAAAIPTLLEANSEVGAVVAAPLMVDGKTWSVTCVSMGNPHCVTFSNDSSDALDVAAIDLATVGPKFENNSAFPARINTEFVEVLSRTELKMRVWERGAGATLACGTGACALVVAAVLEGRAERRCTVHLPGGPLEIDWREEDNHVYMTGPAELVFKGKAYL